MLPLICIPPPALPCVILPPLLHSISVDWTSGCIIFPPPSLLPSQFSLTTETVLLFFYMSRKQPFTHKSIAAIVSPSLLTQSEEGTNGVFIFRVQARGEILCR